MKENNPELVSKLVKYQLQAKDILAKAFLPQEYTQEIPKDYSAALRLAADEYDKRILLEQKNDVLTKENDLLSQKVLKWADRKLVLALVNAYAHSNEDDFKRAWREFKKELLYKYGININLRITNTLNSSGKKTKPKTLEMLDDNELPQAISTAVAMCRDADVDISDIIQKKAS